MSIQKICPKVEDLIPIKIGKSRCSNKDYRKVRNTVHNYHCPVEDCLYNINSERHFPSMKSLRQHYRKVHAPKVLTCDTCQLSFAHPWDLKSHKVSCGQNFACGVCSCTFSSRESLMTHSRRKQHPIPATSNAAKNMDQVNKVQQLVTKAPAPSSVVVLVRSVQRCPHENVRQRPCLLLPKSIPINSLPQPTMASITRSEMATSSQTTTISSQTQTEDSTADCSCGASKRKQPRNIQSLHRLNRRKKCSRTTNASTQTAISGNNWRCRNKQTNPRKNGRRPTRVVQSTWGASGDVPASVDSLDAIGSDSFDAFHLHNTKRVGPQVVSSSADFSCINEMWCSNERQQRQQRMESLGSLDVDVGLSLSMIASCATQTSPRALGSTRMLTLQEILNADSLQEREMVSVLQGTSSDVTHLNCETQTDKGYGCLLCDEHKSTESDDSTIFADIQTQTTGDLESIPYEHLLTNMETQTGNDYSLSDLGFSTIETQTQCETSPINVSSLDSEFVDMQTQTKAHLFQKITQTNYTDTETQTFTSKPTVITRGVFANSHTQTL